MVNKKFASRIFISLRRRTHNYYQKFKSVNNDLKCLNLGCGRDIKKGWINIDVNKWHEKIFKFDLEETLPFEDNSVDYIFSEHFIEHLNIQSQYHLLKECNRVLKSNGVLRLSTPGFDFLIELYLYPDKPFNKKYIDWHYSRFIKEGLSFNVPFKERNLFVFNNMMHDWGHRFIHNINSLKLIGKDIGFTDIIECKPGKSFHKIFRNIESHQFEVPIWVNNMESMVLEMTKI